MTSTPYNAIDVANYIVWRANAMGKPVTHLKLQKLLYYVVAKYLQKYDQNLIEEPILKWQYGPVVKSVYHQFKILGAAPIVELSEYILHRDPINPFSFEWADVDGIVRQLDSNNNLNNIVAMVLNDLINTNPFDLVHITHKEPAWYNYEQQILKGRELLYSQEELRQADYV